LAPKAQREKKKGSTGLHFLPSFFRQAKNRLRHSAFAVFTVKCFMLRFCRPTTPASKTSKTLSFTSALEVEVSKRAALPVFSSLSAFGAKFCRPDDELDDSFVEASISQKIKINHYFGKCQFLGRNLGKSWGSISIFFQKGALKFSTAKSGMKIRGLYPLLMYFSVFERFFLSGIHLGNEEHILETPFLEK
jgi:hypothetical protein